MTSVSLTLNPAKGSSVDYLLELAILEAEPDKKMRLTSLQFALGNLSRWLAIFAVIWLLGAVGLGWLVNSFLILFGLLLLAPVIAFVGFRWWLQRNLVQDKCPVCRYEFTGLNKTELQCPNCGEPLKVEQKHFQRLTPPGTIEVQAVEVESQRIED